MTYFATFALAIGGAWLATHLWRLRGGLTPPRTWTIGAVLTIAILAIPAALRWQVGADYAAYYTNFDRYRTEFAEGPFVLGEPGIRVIARAVDVVGGDAVTMIGAASVVTTSLMVWTLWRWSPAFTFSIAIYFLAGPWLGAFNGVRQYLAAAVLFAGHRFIIDRKVWHWVAIVFAAMLFHVTALVAVLLYFVPTRRTSMKLQLFVIFVGIVGMLSMDSLMIYYESITGNERMWETQYAQNSVNPLRVAFAFVPIALYWLLKVKSLVRTEEAQFYVNVLAVHAATYLAASSSALVTRFAIYTGPFLPLALVFVTWTDNVRDRWIIRGGLVLVYGVFWYTEVTGSSSLSTFQWVFNRG